MPPPPQLSIAYFQLVLAARPCLYCHRCPPQNNAIKTLLAVMESHQDTDIIDRIMVKIANPPEVLVSLLTYLRQNRYVRIQSYMQRLIDISQLEPKYTQVV